jgi:hypothetical protein
MSDELGVRNSEWSMIDSWLCKIIKSVYSGYGHSIGTGFSPFL